MPLLGEVRKACDIGYKTDAKYIWEACLDCRKERWVHLVKGKPYTSRCKLCSGKHSGLLNRGTNNPAWKGGRIVDKDGYVKVRLFPDDPFYSMAHFDGYILEHRLVVAKALGRCLENWEVVHHKEDFAKGDNRYPETLQLVSVDEHDQLTLLIQENKRLKETIRKIQGQIEELECQSKT